MPAGLLWLNAGVFLLYGIAFAIAPEAASHWVTGSVPDTSSGLIDMRSTYGGICIAVGIALAYAATSPALARFGLRLVALVMACMASTRLVGVVIDGTPNVVMWIYLGLEVTVLVLVLFA